MNNNANEQLFARTLLELAVRSDLGRVEEGRILVRTDFIRELQFGDDKFKGFFKFALENKEGFPEKVPSYDGEKYNKDDYLVFSKAHLEELMKIKVESVVQIKKEKGKDK